MAAAEPELVLVVEDAPDAREFLRLAVERGGWQVVAAADGDEAIRIFHARRPDVVLLDVQLPGADGWEVLRSLREVDEHVGVVMLSGTEVSDPDKVRGLLAGADDYLVKPVGMPELQARVAALLRRRRAGGAAPPSAFDDGVLRVDFEQRSVSAGGRAVPLTPLEFRLLAALVRRAGEPVSPRELMQLVWNDHSPRSQAPVKVYVGYLRRKLGEATGGQPLIETVRGFGYRYAPPGASRS